MTSAYSIEIQDMLHYVNTLDDRAWGGDYIFSRESIRSCLEKNLLESRPWDSGEDPIQASEDFDPLYHSKRVAYLVVNPSLEPIAIDVGIPSLGFTPAYLIQDGCHRLAAAIYWGDPYIHVDYAGSEDYFREMFPRAKPIEVSI